MECNKNELGIGTVEALLWGLFMAIGLLNMRHLEHISRYV